MWTCQKCNETIEDNFDACWNCGTEKDSLPAKNASENESSDQTDFELAEQQTPFRGRAQSLHQRYTTAYAVAYQLIKRGQFIQQVAIVLGGLTCLAYIFATVSFNEPVGVFVRSIIFGVVVGTAIYGFGLQTTARGQLLLATLDSAVNSSPFLTDDQKASIMRIK